MKGLGRWKKPILMLSDAVLINLAYILAFYFRYNYKNFKFYSNDYKEIALIVTVIYISCFYLFKLYESLWSYASVDEFMLVIGACITANIADIIFVRIIGHPFAYGVSIVACAFSIIFIVGFRMSFRIYGRFESFVNCNASKNVQKRVMIIGAGAAAAMVIKEMKRSSQSKYMPVVVIDDAAYKKGSNIAGIKILGNRDDIPFIAIEKNIETILIAIPTIEDEDKKQIIEICKKTNCKIEIIPGMYEIINGKVSLNQIRKVEIEDLLGRKAVKLDMQGIASYIHNKIILVTGGGGSIGSELCRQILKFDPKTINCF